MKLTLLTPVKSNIIDSVTRVTLPTTGGEITILPKHESIIVKLTPGTVELVASGKKYHYAVFEGFARINQTEVKIYSAGFEAAENLDEAKIIEAIKKAKEQKSEAVADTEFARVTALLERELAKLKTFKRNRHG